MSKKLSRRLFIIFLYTMLFVAIVNKSSADQSFAEGLAAGAQHKQKTLESLNNFKAKDTFKNFTDSPTQSQYYGGVSQTTTEIKSDAITASTNNEVAKSVNQANENLKSIDKVALANEVDRISKIQDHADDIVKGISDEFVDCTNKESCTTTYQDNQCEDSPDSIQKYCTKVLNIDMIPHQQDTHYTLVAHLSVDDHNYAGINISTVTGKIGFLGPHDASFQLVGRLPSNIDCRTLHGNIVSQAGAAKLDSIDLPSCANGLVLNFHISSGHRKDLQIDIVSSKIIYEPKDRWEDGCIGLASTPSCTLQVEQCSITKSTRPIQNIPVTRDCWEKETTYSCLGSAGTSGGSCKPLRDQGCEQINSVCEDKTDGGCNKYLQTFRCAIKNCAVTGAICNGKTYCIDGDCTDTTKHADPDFQKAISALSAIQDASKHLNQNFIFKGKDGECDNVVLGAANCCRNDGWLIDDVPLLHCSSKEKELGKAKENGVVHYVGQYSDDCALGICLTKRKVYCIFPTKLARIIQEQGRDKQLGRHFGSAKNPDCSGITTEELQKIDFSKIDFKEFYEDIAKKQSMEDENKIDQRIQDKMKGFIDEGKSHESP
ncbi:MAG: type-F conjugative transfer system mating-pair stabilization protein TraN [Gammaproteobacteria bacterium]